MDLICCRCLEIKEFSLMAKGKPYCKVCDSKAVRDYYKRNRDKKKEYSKTYEKRNKLQKKDYWLRKSFGITYNDYEEMLIKQGFCCLICKTHVSELPKMLAVDHCHKTGKIRGLLCGNCNVALGLFQDDPKIILHALSYLSNR